MNSSCDHDGVPDPVTLLREIRAVMVADAGARRFFKANISWIDERIEQWSSKRWRVGLIGITSSGKSALLNALIGERLLPEGVPPSSNALVVCSQGPKKRLRVYFKDGTAKTFTKNLSGRLAHFADERNNQRNKLDVEELHLEIPEFMLGPDLVLVDSPGLDAQSFDDSHEKITLKMLLPTVDLVLFLTTAKANVDKKNLEFIDQISDMEKRLMVVQNKIDSVEPKLGRGGRTVKSAEEVAQEHARKTRHLLSQAKSPVVRQARSMQVSARWAQSKETLARSGVTELCRALKDDAKELEGVFTRGRLTQILRHMKSVLDSQQQGLRSRRGAKWIEKRGAELEECSKKHEKLKRKVRESFAEIDSGVSDLWPRISEAVSRIRNMSEAMLSDAQRVWKDLITRVNALYNQLSSSLSSIQRQTKRLGGLLNLRPEDYNLTEIDLNRSCHGVDVRTNRRTKIKRRKKAGVGGWLGRLLGKESIGWVIQKQSVTVLDPQKTAEALQQHLVRHLEWISRSSERARSDALAKLSLIAKEIAREKKEFEAQRRAIEQEETFERAIYQIEALIAPVVDSLGAKEPHTESQETRPPVLVERLVEIEVAPVVDPICALADRMTGAWHWALKDLALSKCDELVGGSSGAVLVWGWDADFVLDATWRFFGNELDDGIDLDSGLQIFCSARRKLVIVDEERLKERQIELLLSELAGGDFCTWLITDIGQIGATRSTLKRSWLGRTDCLPVGKNPVVWVAQSVRAVVNSGDVLDAYLEWIRTVRGSALNVCTLLANDSEPIYSLLFDLFLGQSGSGSGETLRQEIVAARDFDMLHPEGARLYGVFARHFGTAGAKV